MKNERKLVAVSNGIIKEVNDLVHVPLSAKIDVS